MENVIKALNKKEQAGGDGTFNEVINAIKDFSVFSFGLIPWVSRMVEYGHRGLTYGCMTENYVAVDPIDNYEWINEEFFDHVCYRWFGKGKADLSENFI